MIQENNVNIGIRIPEALRKELQRLADMDNRKLSDYIRLVLVNHIRRVEK